MASAGDGRRIGDDSRNWEGKRRGRSFSNLLRDWWGKKKTNLVGRGEELYVPGSE